MTPAEHAASSIIVVPCYNEAKRLHAAAFREFAANHPQMRFLFVDDGSTDVTRLMIDALAAENAAAFSVVSLRKNRGKAEAVRRGFLEAFTSGPAYVGFWDADLATPLEDIPAFIAVLDERPEVQMVFGSRVALLNGGIKRKANRRFIGRAFASAAAKMLRLPVSDTQCGAKLFRISPPLEEAFREPFISKWAFDVEILARLIRARRGTNQPPVEETIHEYPLEKWHDVAGSKLRFGDYLKAGIDLVRIYRRYMVTR